MSALIHNIHRSENLIFSYWSNRDTSNLDVDQPVIIVLPPGPYLGDYMSRIEFSKKSYVIGIDYPGRGKSSPLECNTIDCIASEVGRYIKALEFKNIELLGISYGSAVATKIVQAGDLNVRSVKLIAPGEYIKSRYIPFLKLLFIPAFLSERIRRFYRWGILKLNVNDFFPKENLKYFLKQFYGNIDYKIDTSITSKIPCKMVVYSGDKIVRKGSLEKVKTVFSNNEVEIIPDNAQHLDDLNKKV